MKKAMVILVALIPLFANAEGASGGNPQQMQGMMQKVQKMQACMQNIDQGQMKAIKQKGQQIGGEIKALCAAGKRSQAQTAIVSYGKDMMTNSTIQEMKKCAEIMKGIAPDMMKMTEPYLTESSEENVCDE